MGSRIHRILICSLFIALAWSLRACVTVYQPLSALQRPVLVDPQAPNLSDVHITLHCLSNEFLERNDAQLLCRRLTSLFIHQGADVVSANDVGLDEYDETETAGDANEKPIRLTVTLRARLLHKETNPLLWTLSFMTTTLVPAFSEYSFAQDISITDESGSLLVYESLEGRFMIHFGVIYWAITKVIDWVVREPNERVSGDAAQDDFSRDFYGQLSQLVFNARMRQSLLQSGSVSMRP